MRGFEGTTDVAGSVGEFSSPNGERPFYGWRIVYVGMALMFVSSGIGFHCNGVILDPLRNLHGWNKGTISAAITLFFFINGLVGIVVGKKVDELGSRSVLVFGAAIHGLGLISLSFIHTVWQLFLAYAFMSVGFACTSTIAISAVITNWFIKKRGSAMSVTMTGISLGGIVIVPLASLAVTTWGIRISAIILGIFLWLGVIPLTLKFIRQHPSEIGQYPDGETAGEGGAGRDRLTASDFVQLRRWTQRQAIGTIAFWAIVVTFLLAFCSQIAFSIHQISFLSQFLGVTWAAMAVSLATGASVVGRLGLGTIVDRYNKRLIMALCMLSQTGLMVVLAFFHQTAVLYVCTALFGLTMGYALILQSLIIGECFGMVSFGTVSGLASLFIQCGAAFGPLIAGTIYDATHSYQVAFLIFSTMNLVAAVTVVFAKPPTTAG